MCGKMAEELLSLKWNNHQAHFVDILTFLREQEIFVDATLACGGKLYAAHKFVLSTCSDYFKQMFTRSPSKHPIVYMKDVTARDLEALLDFMYNGEVNVPQSSLGSLIKTAEGLQIKGLAVPDDPPAPKRERDREKENRDYKVHSEHSPPAKRPRPRERSPPHSTPSLPQTPSVPRSRSPHPPTPSGASQVGMPPVEATLDEEDSRTSVHSANSNISEQNSAPSLSSKQLNSGQASSGDTTPHQEQLPSNPTKEPSPGPSGIHNPQQSKQEPEVDIKQEDVVDLGEDDEGEWNLEGDGGGGDSSMGSENPNFPEVMLPHADGSVPTSGDPAMTMRLILGELGEAGGGAPLVDGGNSYPLRRNQPSTTTATSTSSTAAGGENIGSAVPPPPDLDILEYCLNDAVGDQLPGEPRSPRLPTSTAATTTTRGSGTTSSGDQAVMAGALLYQCRPFACRYCAKRFKRKDHLVEHERTHTGERPYVCNVCGKSFAKKTNLNTHSRSHHQQQQQFCHLHAS